MLVDTDDETLLGLLHSKNTRREAFEQVLKKYQQKIYFFLRRTGLEHEVTDQLLQDIFLKFWKLPNAENEGNSLIITLYRLSVARLKNNNLAGLRGLTQQEHIIVVLKTQEDFDFQEIAQIVAIPVNEVRNFFNTGISRIKIDDN